MPSKNTCHSLLLLKQGSEIRPTLTRGQEWNIGTSQWKHIRKKMRIRDFVGHSEYLKCQSILWDWVLDTVNWKDKLHLHVAEKCQKELENIFLFYKFCTYANRKNICESKSMYVRIFNLGMVRIERKIHSATSFTNKKCSDFRE